MLGLVRELLHDEGGTTAMEYGFCAVLISLAAMAAYTSLGSSLIQIFGYVDGGIIYANGGS